MSQHLKSIVKNRLNSIISRYIPNAEVSASHRRGVCYLEFTLGIDMYYGIMNSHKEGRHYNKHIIVRRAPRWGGKLHQLYTYHFPKTWSAACVENRNLIKAAQKIAHALEHDHSLASLEWRLRFFRHYFRVVKGGAAPEHGMKAYSRFYQPPNTPPPIPPHLPKTSLLLLSISPLAPSPQMASVFPLRVNPVLYQPFSL